VPNRASPVKGPGVRCARIRQPSRPGASQDLEGQRTGRTAGAPFVEVLDRRCAPSRMTQEGRRRSEAAQPGRASGL